MARYSKQASRKVAKALHERKRGTLRSGSTGKKVTSRKQAIAIGLSEARSEGAKVPKKKTASKKQASGKSAKKKAARKTAAKKASRKKTASKKPAGSKKTASGKRASRRQD